MADEPQKTSEVKFTVHMDENHIPVDIEWYSSDNDSTGKCGAAFLALWDEKEGNTLRIDLWQKEFPLDTMKKFFHQNLVTLADTFQRATGEEAIVEDLRDYCDHFAEKMGLEEEDHSKGSG